MFNRTLNISTSPHLKLKLGTEQIMLNVVIALLPPTIFAVFAFGLNALLLISTTVLSAVLTEHLLCKASGKESTIGDWSAVITGLLLALTLPPIFPLWMAAIGGIISIALGKFIFGGLGYNAFNPALVGRAVLQAAFPVAITTWYPAFNSERFLSISGSTLTFPFLTPIVDSTTGATPLSAFKFEGITPETKDLALGLISGSAGETCAVLIILGGIYLIVRKMMNWKIPVTILLTVLTLSAAFYLIDPKVYPSPWFMMFSGGLMLGAVYMATDMVGSPMTSTGVVIYGVLIGVLVYVIRVWGGLPEGVMYAILLGNASSIQIDRLLKTRVYGTINKAKKNA